MKVDEILSEGIKYFRLSDRIEGYIKILNKKKVKDEKAHSLISEMESLKKKFSNIEKEYKNSKSKEELKNIKEKWEVLKIRNDKLLSLVRKEEYKKAAIAAGILAILLSAFLFIKHGIDKNIEKIDNEIKETEKPKPDWKKPSSYPVPEQINNPDLASPINSYKGFVIPEKDYSKEELKKILIDEAKKQNFPAELALSLAKNESSFDSKVISSDRSSVGLLQLNLNFSDEFKNKYYKGDAEFNPFDPKMNAEAGIRYLKYLIKANDGNIEEALKDYNAGPNRTKTTPGTLAYALRVLKGANLKSS